MWYVFFINLTIVRLFSWFPTTVITSLRLLRSWNHNMPYGFHPFISWKNKEEEKSFSPSLVSRCTPRESRCCVSKLFAHTHTPHIYAVYQLLGNDSLFKLQFWKSLGIPKSWTLTHDGKVWNCVSSSVALETFFFWTIFWVDEDCAKTHEESANWALE